MSAETRSTCLAPSVKADFLQTPSGRRCNAMLSSGISASKLLDMVRAACARNISSLATSKRHLARDLCGAAFWATLNDRQIPCAGMCLVFLVKRGLLPLRLHQTRSGKGSKHYWVTSGGPVLFAPYST